MTSCLLYDLLITRLRSSAPLSKLGSFWQPSSPGKSTDFTPQATSASTSDLSWKPSWDDDLLTASPRQNGLQLMTFWRRLGDRTACNGSTYWELRACDSGPCLIEPLTLPSGLISFSGQLCCTLMLQGAILYVVGFLLPKTHASVGVGTVGCRLSRLHK